MEPLISVIIPVYKVEPYLRKCIDSVRNQTYRNLEIILVDDGSPDHCGQICDEYAAADSRIRVIHKENGGLSSARNAGIRIARGEYLGFVDSDDWIEPDMYAFLYAALEKETADLAVCGVYTHKDSNVNVGSNASLYLVQSGHDAVQTFLKLASQGKVAWNKLYKRQLFSEIRFPEGRLWEDCFIMGQVIDKAEKVVYHMQPKYHYILRPGSITTAGYRPALHDCVDAYLVLHQYVSQKYPDLTALSLYGCLWAHFKVLDAMLLFNGPTDSSRRKEYIRFIRTNRKAVLHERRFGKSRKLAAFLPGNRMVLYRLYLKLRSPRK